MGYIFDALNKQDPNAPKDRPDKGQDEAEGSALTEALAMNPQADEAAPAPLRLTDLQVNDAEQAEPIALIDEPTAQKMAEQTDTIDEQSDEGAAVTPAVPAKKSGGFWNWLLSIPLRGKLDDRLVSMTSPASSVAEEYRSIRTSILARHENERNLVHTITSATPQEGKTITCVNLGLSFAELRNRKTIIIECDMRLPTFAKLLPCDQDKPGLIDYLRGDASLSDCIQTIEGSALNVIPAGGRVSDEAVQLLSSNRMTRLIHALRAKYDHVLIDTPPVLQLADAGILGSQSEEVLLVARMRRTPRTLVEQAVSTLTSYNATVNGIIATDNPRSRGRGYGYRYGYRYGYGYGYGYTDDKRRRKARRAA